MNINVCEINLGDNNKREGGCMIIINQYKSEHKFYQIFLIRIISPNLIPKFLRSSSLNSLSSYKVLISSDLRICTVISLIPLASRAS